MINYLAKKFINNYQNYDNNKVREQYGTLCSLVSIGCNIILVLFKLTMGGITNSIAIIADGLNNLSDVGSNLASLFGFKLANKHPDAEHPYGHGRIEYVAGLIIAFLIILLVGFQSLRDSVLKIFNPEKVVFTYIAAIILVVSIFIKLYMAHFNKIVAAKINSTTLQAASQDSLNDCLTTAASLIALIASIYTDLPIDGIIGSLVSIIVLKSGIEIFKDTVNPLLGMAPDKELVKEIADYILSEKDWIKKMEIVMILGNLTEDAVSRTIQDKEVVTFRVAVGKRSQTGNSVTFYSCVLSKNSKITEFLKKGQKVAVVGRLNIQEAEKEGKHYTNINVSVLDIELAGFPKEAE